MLERLVLWVAVLATAAAATLQARAWWSGRSAPSTSEATWTEGVDTSLVLILSSTCPSCTQQPEMSRIGDLIEQAGRRPRVHTLGISVDADAKKGARFLRSYAEFHQYAYGGGWTNWIVSDILWGDTLSLAGIPQLVVVERSIREDANRLRETRSILNRAYGPTAVLAWLTTFAGNQE